MTERGGWDDVNVEGHHDIECWNDKKNNIELCPQKFNISELLLSLN